MPKPKPGKAGRLTYSSKLSRLAYPASKIDDHSDEEDD